jgi:hypothetical protein
MPRSREVLIPFGEVELAGTLHLPDAEPPHPAVIMLHGSGVADRDSGDFFPPIRKAFLGAGLAVLSWDKQGIGESGGDWRQQTIPGGAVEAHAAFRWLRDQPEIDADRIGAWGHSQGGWVGPLLAAREPRVAALVIHSGTGLTPSEQDHVGMEQELRRDGADEEDVAQGHAYLDALHAAARTGMPFAAFDREVQAPARGTAGYGYFGEIDAAMWPFFVRNAAEPFDPLATLRSVRCPVLAIFGGDDVLIPVERSVDLVWETVGVNNPDVTVRVYPGASHRLLAGDPPAHPEGYLDAMSGWLRNRLNVIPSDGSVRQ